MSTYYLPIKIDERRIHICELKAREQNQAGEVKDTIDTSKAVFGFLITGRTLFSTYTESENELICDDNANIELKGHHFKVYKEDSVYVFEIVNNTDSKTTHEIGDKLPFGIEKKGSFERGGIVVKITRRVESFVICIRHKHKDPLDENALITYEYYFKGYKTDYNHIIDAALDFGSEASQIKVGSSRNAPKNIIDILKRKYYNSYKSYATLPSENGFWQSDEKPTLYKSNYFVHKEPKITKYAEAPNANDANTFVSVLTSRNEDDSFYDIHILLPNLKLMDLMAPTILAQMAGDPIKVPTGSDLFNTGAFGDVEFRDDTLRIILGNLLHVIIESATPLRVNGNQYLRLSMMMPNVYGQEKVYKIIEGLYKDFYTIQQEKFDGIEVVAISESDASFLGAVRGDGNEKILHAPNFKDGYFLIIDAGKGTTDFSVMKSEDGDPNKWNSLFRGGLPASGQTLTYAIYEALYAYFLRKYNVDLDQMIRDCKDHSTKMDFMNAIEMYKRSIKDENDRTTLKECADSEITDNHATLEEIVNSINTMVEQHKAVYDTKRILKEKINDLADLVVKDIKEYMSTRDPNAKFSCVLLTGRAFMLYDFKKAIEEKLKGLMIDPTEKPVDFNGDTLKSVCLDGAISINSTYHINNNSELIGKPAISVFNRNNKPESQMKKIFSIFIRKTGLVKLLQWFGVDIAVHDHDVSSEEEFLFCGEDVNGCQNIKIIMGTKQGRVTNPNRVYYIGRDIICKLANGNCLSGSQFLATSIQERADRMNRLITESLFPYLPGTIPATGQHEPLTTLNTADTERIKHTTTTSATTNANNSTNNNSHTNTNSTDRANTNVDNIDLG